MGSIENDFRGTVPPCDNVFGECGGGFLVASGESEVAHFEVAVFVQEQVGGLQVAVDDVGRVDVQTAAQKLVHEVLDVVIRQILPRIDHSVHIRLHQVRYNVDVFVPSWRWRLLNIDQRYNVLVVEKLYTYTYTLGGNDELTEQFDFTHYAFGIDQVFESLGHFLNSHFDFGLVVIR